MKASGNDRGKALLLLLILVATTAAWAGERKTENVILVTLDGARTQEVFGGLDLDVLRAVTKEGDVRDTPIYRKFWAPGAEERREKLLPFFWRVLMREHGSVAGNRALGSTAQVRNRHRFSYPGYSEILTGRARDGVIDSNDPRQNPFPTVLEFLKKRLELDARRVAAFSSWEILDGIVEHEAGSITSNAGFEPYDHPDPRIRDLSRLQLETRTPWDSVRHDSYTFRMARAHLEAWKPRVLYIAFGETDDWSHDGRYDRTLQALERTDAYLRELWEALEASEAHRGKTSIVITTDHGRGNTPKDWTDHGARVEGAQHIWIAFVSPDSALRGEWSSTETVWQDQIAATLCRLLGIDPGGFDPEAGPPIERIFAK